MEKHEDLCYFERLKMYQTEKEQWIKAHVNATFVEFEKAIRNLAEKWRV